MTTLTNCTKQAVAVADVREQKVIAPGASVDVDGHLNWKEHLFVKAGWLTLSESEREPEPEPVANQEPEVTAPDPEPVKASNTKRRKR